MGYPTSWFAVFIVTVAIILVILAVLFGAKIVKPGAGFGVYGPVQEGVCGADGTRIDVQECFPSITTGRGCINDGIQTFAPKVFTTPCTQQNQISVWETELGPCIDVSPDPLVPIFQQTNRKTCVPKDPTGVNGCLNVERLPNGVPGIVPYNIGDVITWTQTCTPLTPIEPPGYWLYQDATSTPTFQNQFSSLPDCQIDASLDPTYSILTEGYARFPMTCSTGSDSGCFQLVPTEYRNGQICNPVLPDPASVLDQTLPETVNPILCNTVPPPGATPGATPTVILPCRLRPSNIIDFGFGPDINVLSNSAFLMVLPGGYTISSIQTPALQSNPQVKRFFDWMNTATDATADTPLVWLNPAIDTRVGCTPQEISFNTGLLSMVGIRSIASPTVISEAVIGTMIPSSYRGWLKVVDGIGVWTEASAAYITPGLFSNMAQHFSITILAPLDPTPPPGYPTTSYGTLRVRIRTLDNQPILIPSVQMVVGGATGQYKSLEDVNLLLFALNTELCTRSLRDQFNCTLLFGTPVPPPINPTPICEPPLLTPFF